MKKKILLGLLVAMVLVTAGCGKEDKAETLSCTLYTKDVANGYELNSTYVVEAVNAEALKTTSKEVVTSDNKTVLDYFEETLESTYSASKDAYGGYDYTISKDGNTLTADVKINYNEMDLDAFVKDQPTMKSYVSSNNKLKLDGLKSLYESLGATCELK